MLAWQSASAIRLQIETTLAHRIPSALTPAQRIIRPVRPTGVAAVDELLDGGLPIGAITEMVGPECSGRTSLTLSYLARVTQEGSVVAWIDACDTLHAESAAAAGVDLSRLLWVRCGVPAAIPKQTSNYQFTLPDKYRISPQRKQELHGKGLGSHPLNETKGLSKPWARIEQALGATDLLLQGGGFSAIVLDIAGVAAQYASRVELSIWFRYRAAVERSQASLLLLTQHSCAKSAGELLLRFQPGNARNNERTVFTGIEHRLEVERRRFAPASTNVIPLKKPPQRESWARWSSQSTWAGAR